MQSLRNLLQDSTFRKPDLTAEEWAEQNARAEEWEAERLESEKARRIERAGVPADYLNVSFTSAEVERWADAPTKGLLIQGAVGRGKTHNACAAILRSIENGMTAKFTTFDDLLRECKATYQNAETEKAVIGRYANTGVLCIDDMGKERVTEWSLPIIFGIINKRSMNGRPTIVTTQYTGKQLIQRMTVNGESETARAIISRFCEYEVVVIEGRDWRRK